MYNLEAMFQHVDIVHFPTSFAHVVPGTIMPWGTGFANKGRNFVTIPPTAIPIQCNVVMHIRGLVFGVPTT